jgi:signal transduction histidine kinase
MRVITDAQAVFRAYGWDMDRAAIVAGPPRIYRWARRGGGYVGWLAAAAVATSLLIYLQLLSWPVVIFGAAVGGGFLAGMFHMRVVARDNERLIEEVSRAGFALHESRARVAASAARERRRIGRDLHDGAQQRLVALRIELELAEELIGRDPRAGRERVREIEGMLDDALEQLRVLAHGVRPQVLAERGVVDALHVAARPLPIPVEIEAHRVARLAPEVESAVYFTIVEALQNVLKHANAHRAVVRLDGSAATLRFSVRDDGVGMAAGPRARGMGMANMRERIVAIGGDIEITSVQDVGTTVRGFAPTDLMSVG